MAPRDPGDPATLPTLPSTHTQLPHRYSPLLPPPHPPPPTPTQPNPTQPTPARATVLVVCVNRCTAHVAQVGPWSRLRLAPARHAAPTLPRLYPVRHMHASAPLTSPYSARTSLCAWRAVFLPARAHATRSPLGAGPARVRYGPSAPPHPRASLSPGTHPPPTPSPPHSLPPLGPQGPPAAAAATRASLPCRLRLTVTLPSLPADGSSLWCHTCFVGRPVLPCPVNACCNAPAAGQSNLIPARLSSRARLALLPSSKHPPPTPRRPRQGPRAALPPDRPAAEHAYLPPRLHLTVTPPLPPAGGSSSRSKQTCPSYTYGDQPAVAARVAWPGRLGMLGCRDHGRSRTQISLA